MSTIAAQGQLPLFTVPDVRRDCEMRLAALFRDICYQHSIEGCHAGNAWLGRQIGTSADHVRALLRRLVDLGWIEVRVDHGNRRTIIPLVTLAAAMRCWQALCRAVLSRKEFPARLRELAGSLIGIKIEPDLETLGLTPEEIQAPASPKPFGKSSGKSSGTPYKETEGKESSQPDPSIVTIISDALDLPPSETKALAVRICRMGGTREHIEHSLQVLKSKANVFSPGGFLISAIRAAQAGTPYRAVATKHKDSQMTIEESMADIRRGVLEFIEKGDGI